MSFDHTTLITDRTAADVARVKALAAKGWANMTDAEKAEWSAGMKGAYNASDMNRVTAAMEYLKELYDHYGYAVNYTPIYIDRTAVPTSRLPEGYTEVEYIQSSGTQYVDTGFVPDANTQVEMDFQLISPGTANHCLFGVAGQFSFRWYGSKSTFRSNGGENVDFATGIDAETRHTVVKTATQTIIDGAYSVTTTAATISLTLYLLAMHQASAAAQYASARLYACKIYDNGTLIRDYVPCINASAEVGLYDLVNNQFYGNAGTGTFMAGDAVEYEPSESDETLDPYTWYVSDIPKPEQCELIVKNLRAFWSSVEQAGADVDAVWEDSSYGYVYITQPITTGDYVSLTEAHGIRELIVTVKSAKLSDITAFGDGWTFETNGDTLTARYTIPGGVYTDLQSSLYALTFLCSAEDYANATVTISALMRSGATIQLGSGVIRWATIINWAAFEAYEFTWQMFEDGGMTWNRLEQLPIPTGGST